MKNYKKLPIDPTPTPPMLTRTTVLCPLTRERGRVRRGWWVRGRWGYVTLRGTSWVGGYVGGGGIRWGGGGVYVGGGGCTLGGIRWGGGGYVGGGVRWVDGSTWRGTSWLGSWVRGYVGGGGGTWGGGGYVGAGVDVRSWSKMLFLDTFWKIWKLLQIGRPWMNAFVRVLLKVAKIRVIIYKIESISWTLCTKNNPLYWKQKWIIIDYNGL